VRQLVGLTLPSLDAVQLKPVWIDARWITCATPTPAVSAMLGLASSLAARDFPQAGAGAAALMKDHRGSLSESVRDWLLRVCMLAAIAEGHYADVATLDTTLGGDVTSLGWNGLQRSYLVAFAAAQETPALSAK